MKLPQSPILIPVILFTLGATLSFLISISFQEVLKIGIGFLLFMGLLQFLKGQKLLKSLFLFSSFLLLGFIYFKGYYTPSKNHFQSFNNNKKGLKQIEIQSLLGNYSFSNNYIGKISSWGKHKVEGKILIRQSKDSTTKPWSIGQKILTNERLSSIKGPLNPGQFSYKNYLANKKIYHQLDLNSGNSFKLPNRKRTFRSFSSSLERNAFDQIETSPLSVSSQGMLKALLFAERNALDDSIVQNYTKAGVIHLLALSGLHIGLFVGFFMLLLKPLLNFRYGSSIRMVIIICFLWLFTFFVGFPPSVTRAVTMFSFMVVGRALHYGKHTFHYTVLSFFLLLFCYPPYLRSIGFQLSYLAVFGILLIHPLLQQVWNPKYFILKRYWEWTTVCLAAQLAVSPISIYYFHQFPSLFLVSNLLIIPFFGLFLIFCILVFFMLLFFSIPTFITVAFEKVVTLLNKSIRWIAQQEAFLFDELYHSTASTLFLYSLLIFSVFWGYKKNIWNTIPVGLVLCGLLLNCKIEKKKINTENSFWIFHRHNASLVGHQKGSLFYYYSSENQETKRLLEDFANSRVLSEKTPIRLANFYVQDDFKLMILDNEKAYDLVDFEPQYILLRNNPKLNLNRLLRRYKPKVLIADGTNAPWNTSLWEKSCADYGVKFHNTRLDGALKINL
ncbi:ComEC family competence protein [Flavobacteriaceae bacterium]|nr:ComEC family competence protein [Flavobacteriaceae bacterium]